MGSTVASGTAEKIGSGRPVALKLLAPELARDERLRQRFLRESQLAAGLDHPHVVTTLGSGEENGVQCPSTM